MRNFFVTSVLVVFALFCLLTAWSSGFAPQQFARNVGLLVASADGLNEIRAQYAGFFLVTALLCVAALARRIPRLPVFTLLMAIFGGLIGGRLVSLALDRGLSGYGPMIRSLYVIDAVGFALTIAAILADRTPRESRIDSV